MVSERKRMTKGMTLAVYVTRIQNARRNFQKARVLHYTHDIYFVDAEGNNYLGEYITEDTEQHIFKPGSYAYVECVFTASLGDEIKPYGDVMSWQDITFPIGIGDKKEKVNERPSLELQQFDTGSIDKLIEEQRKTQQYMLLQAAATLTTGYMFASGALTDEEAVLKTMGYYNELSQQVLG